jgi:hypothetical protein
MPARLSIALFFLAARAASAVQPPAVPPPNPYFQEWQTRRRAALTRSDRAPLPAIERASHGTTERWQRSREPASPTFANTVGR